MEEMVSIDSTFSDEELVQPFIDYDNIKSFRLSNVPNTWCIWGELDEPDDVEYNKLASIIVGEEIFSHIIFIHDSEINLDWNMTDPIIYKLYKEFLNDIGALIKEVMVQITEEVNENYQEAENASMIFLTALGHTEDKRVLFSFDPTEQSDSFYTDGSWQNFAPKIFEHLNKNFSNEPTEKGKPFVIFSDTKTIVIIEDKYVDQVVYDMIKYFQSKEDYEKCSKLADIKNAWYIKNAPPIEEIIDSYTESKQMEIGDPSLGSIKRKRGRPRKT